MFELLADGTVEMLCNKFKAKGIPYGFGGIAQLGQGDLPAEYVIAEHYRLGSSMAILSRSFCNVNKIDNIKTVKDVFGRGVNEIRNYEHKLELKDMSFFEHNRVNVRNKVMEIESNIDKEKTREVV